MGSAAWPFKLALGQAGQLGEQLRLAGQVLRLAIAAQPAEAFAVGGAVDDAAVGLVS